MEGFNPLLKRGILEFISKWGAVVDVLLYNTFGTNSDTLRAISELVQANELKRIEFIANNEHTRRAVYFLASTDIMY